MCLTNDKTRPIYVVIEEMVWGTAEDDLIIGYFTDKKKAEDFVYEKSKENEELHYSIREIFEL